MVTAPFLPACLRHDVGLAGVLLGVEDLVRNAPALEDGGQSLALGDGDGAHQDGLAVSVKQLDFIRRRPELGALGLVNHVLVVHTDHRAVGGNHQDIQVVDFGEFFRFCVGGARHA